MTQYATQCSVSTSYTFTEDGKSAGSGGEPQEANYFQVQVVDDAGNRSGLSAPIYIYHDTISPGAPEVEVSQDNDDITIHGEKLSYTEVIMKAPNGSVTTSKTMMLNPDGFTDEYMHLVFNDTYGTYTVEAKLFDAAGNISTTTTKTFERTQEVQGGMGGGNGIQNVDLGNVEFDVRVFSSSHMISNPKVPTPLLSSAQYSDDQQSFTLNGTAVTKGDTATAHVTFDDSYIPARIKNENCGWISWYLPIYIKCIAGYSALNTVGLYKKKYDVNGSVTSAKIKTFNENDTSLKEFDNTRNFSEAGIPIKNNAKKVAANSTVSTTVKIDGKDVNVSGFVSNKSEATSVVGANQVATMDIKTTYANHVEAAIALSKYLAIPKNGSAYSILSVVDPKNNPTVPQAMKDVFPQATEWNPALSPDSYMQCVAFVVHAFALTNNPYNGSKGNAELWSTYTSHFDVYTSGQSTVMPQVGDLAVWNNRHIGIITEINNKGEIYVTQANTDSLVTIKTFKSTSGKIIIEGNDPFNHWLRRK